MATESFVAYYRVSTDKQGRSGLGLDAQRAAVTARIGAGQLVAEFAEIESGRKNDRPQLAAALAACKARKAKLVIARLDRLARDAAFLLSLRDSGIRFEAADLPDANRLTVGILALVAEEEALAISQRTKAALAAAKAKGIKLGSPENLTAEGRQRGSAAGGAAYAKKATERAEDLRPVLADISASGVTGYRAIARELDSRGIPTPRGTAWDHTKVKNLLARLGLNAPAA